VKFTWLLSHLHARSSSSQSFFCFINNRFGEFYRLDLFGRVVEFIDYSKNIHNEEILISKRFKDSIILMTKNSFDLFIIENIEIPTCIHFGKPILKDAPIDLGFVIQNSEIQILISLNSRNLLLVSNNEIKNISPKTTALPFHHIEISPLCGRIIGFSNEKSVLSISDMNMNDFTDIKIKKNSKLKQMGFFGSNIVYLLFSDGKFLFYEPTKFSQEFNVPSDSFIHSDGKSIRLINSKSVEIFEIVPGKHLF
jgi:hypothetical protein